ncbi:GWxTD domain-containing protein [bacterium]|nr:GWxTD domain-containing protein [bacterium]
MNRKRAVTLFTLLIITPIPFFSIFAMQDFMGERGFAVKDAFNFDYIALLSDDLSKSHLKMFVSVVYDDLTFLKENDKFTAKFSLSFAIMKDEDKYIDSRQIAREVVTDDYFKTNSRELFDQVEAEFDLEPGKYRVVIEMIDRGSREPVRMEKHIEIPDRTKSPLLISGPILLDSVVVDDNGIVKLRPGMSGTVFEGVKSIWVYFELQAENYPVTVDFTYSLLNSKGEEKINGKFSRYLESAVLRDKFPLDINEFPFDDYQLVLSAAAGEYSTHARKKFRIHWPELPPFIHDLELAVEQLEYVATNREIEKIKQNYLGRRLEFFLNFWSKWGEDDVESYRLMEEYYRRITEANQLFGSNGWRTDRGHVYVVFGPPSEVDRHPFNMEYKAYEIWYYFETNRRFVFVDENGFGDYRLKSPFWGN